MKVDNLCRDNRRLFVADSEQGAVARKLGELRTQKGDIPVHVAIIPDGNRRWAKLNCLGVAQGHNQGVENVMSIMRTAKTVGHQVYDFLLVFNGKLDSR